MCQAKVYLISNRRIFLVTRYPKTSVLYVFIERLYKENSLNNNQGNSARQKSLVDPKFWSLPLTFCDQSRFRDEMKMSI